MTDHLPESPEACDRVRRYLDERARPMPFAPQGFLPTDFLSEITRTGDRLLASDLRALVDATARLTAQAAEREREVAAVRREERMRADDQRKAWQRTEAAEAALDDLRAGIEALADEWAGITGDNTVAVETWHDAAESLRALLATEDRHDESEEG